MVPFCDLYRYSIFYVVVVVVCLAVNSLFVSSFAGSVNIFKISANLI